MRRGSTYFTSEEGGEPSFVHVYIDLKLINRRAAEAAFPGMTDLERISYIFQGNPGLSGGTMITKDSMYESRNVWPRIFETDAIFHGLPGNCTVRTFQKADNFSGDVALFIDIPILSSYRFVTRGLNVQWENAGPWSGSITIGSGSRYDMVGVSYPSEYQASQYGLDGYFYYYKMSSDYAPIPGGRQTGKVNGIYIG